MFTINETYLSLPYHYLFAEVRKRAEEYKRANPKVELIQLGIGDVTLPLVPAVVEAMHKAVEEMGRKKLLGDTGAVRDMNFCGMP